MAVAAAGGLLAYRTGSAYSALFAVLLVGYNLSSIKQLRGHQRTGRLAELYAAGRYDDVVDTAGAIAADTTAPNADRCIAARYEAVGLVLTNRYEEARAVLRRFDELDLGAGFAGYILAATGDPTGLVVARDAARAAPSPESIKWYAQALMISGQGSEAARVVEAHADLVERAEAEELTGIAFHAGEFTAAGRIADAARRTDPAYATLAYNGACSWSRAGAQRAAYASLEAAVRLGWSDFDQIDTDADLTGLRDTPEWVGQRARLAAVRPSTAGADPRRV